MKKPKRAKRAARLSPYQHMTSCCVRGWGGRKPEPCGGGLITAWTRTPAFHRCSFPVAGDAQTTAAYYQIPPPPSGLQGRGRGSSASQPSSVRARLLPNPHPRAVSIPPSSQRHPQSDSQFSASLKGSIVSIVYGDLVLGFMRAVVV